ncbi:ABC transporter permease [Candidatus Acetatifactor stercoripullorum]|uniref:ABC transporter permease n=1 Tax=Candidatus Acetatifactor stercoripullorum TaxID=2838414 RepID=UPI00298DBBD8|nr:ABC transporter permease [Candidatus Acetatifactor stercoripullorum]
MSKMKRSSRWKNSRILKVLFSRRTIVLCMIVLALMILAAVFAPLIAPYEPNEDNLRSVLQGSSAAHPLGTDGNGRDVLSRMIFGSRVSFIVGIVAVLIASMLGMALGLIAGMTGGIVDTIIMRVMDAMMAIPMIIMSMFLGAIFGQGLGNICLAIGIVLIPNYARVTRGQVLSIRKADYVTAGILSGASAVRNTIVHVLPNCLSANIVLMTSNLGVAILSEASLSFLGMGINPPTPSLGGMVSDGYRYLSMNPIIAIAPGVYIMILVLCFNMVGDALRDAMDPKLRGTLGGKKRIKRR